MMVITFTSYSLPTVTAIRATNLLKTLLSKHEVDLLIAHLIHYYTIFTVPITYNFKEHQLCDLNTLQVRKENIFYDLTLPFLSLQTHIFITYISLIILSQGKVMEFTRDSIIILF